MLYVQRDDAGTIVAIFKAPNELAREAVSPRDDEVVHFLLAAGDESANHAYLIQSDLEMARVVEDLIELLIRKNLILLTEFPEAAQKKLLNRKQIRESTQQENPLLVENDIPL